MQPEDLNLVRQIALDFGVEAHSVDFIAAGFSEDRKYRVRTTDRSYLLRVSDAKRELERRLEFDSLVTIHGQGIPCSEPFQFRVTPDHCLALYSYIEGECADTALPRLPSSRQHEIGLDAGRILRQIHGAIPKDGPFDECAQRGTKFFRHREMLRISGVTYLGQKRAEAFVEKNLEILRDRPVAFRHGDYHPSNLIIRGDGSVGVIDFNRCDFGDPYDDFYKTAYFGAPLSAAYAKGLILGYFEGNPPEEFWLIYNVYVAAVLPSDIVWAQMMFPDRVQEAIDRVERISASHDFVHGGPPNW